MRRRSLAGFAPRPAGAPKPRGATCSTTLPPASVTSKERWLTGRIGTTRTHSQLSGTTRSGQKRASVANVWGAAPGVGPGMWGERWYSSSGGASLCGAGRRSRGTGLVVLLIVGMRDGRDAGDAEPMKLAARGGGACPPLWATDELARRWCDERSKSLL